MSYAVAVISIGLYVVLRKRLAGKFNNKLWFVAPALLLMATCSLANTGLGAWIAHTIIGGLLGLLGGAFGISTSLLAGGIALIMLAGAVIDLWDKKPDGFAKTAIIALPLLVILAAGPVASTAGGLFDSIAGVGHNGIAALIGG